MSEFRKKNIEPVPEEVMLAGGPEDTICGVLREIYANSRKKKVKRLTRTAMAMAKRMAIAINRYRNDEKSSPR